MSRRQPEFTVRVTCDHRGSGIDADPVPVALIGYVPNRDGALGFIEWREYEHTPGQTEWAMQTYFGEADRLGTFGQANPGDEVPGMTEGQRWRFRCTVCGETKPVRQTRLEPLLAKMRDARIDTLPLAVIAAMM